MSGPAVALLLLVSGCEEQPEIPPEALENAAPKSKLEIDRAHAITLQLDRPIILTNIVLVVQKDPTNPGSLAVSLVTSRPGEDDSRLAFGTFEPADSVDDLLDREIRFSSGSYLSEHTSAVHTAVATYQPKMVALRITSAKDQEARGTLSGEFYRFQRLHPTVRPDVVAGTGTFTALLIVR